MNPRWRAVLALAAALAIPACDQPEQRGPDGSGEQPLGSGQPPNVMIVSPGSSTTVQEGATLSVQVAAVSPDAAIVQVDLFDGSQKVASRNAAPFIFALGGLSAGAHVLTAVAIDVQGLLTSSAPVTVFVTARGDS